MPLNFFKNLDCVSFFFFFFQETLWYSVDKVTANACNAIKIIENASREVLEASFMMLENETHQMEKGLCMRMKLM